MRIYTTKDKFGASWFDTKYFTFGDWVFFTFLLMFFLFSGMSIGYSFFNAFLRG